MAETGHVKNVEHFQMMIAAVQGYGGAYKPVNVTSRFPTCRRRRITQTRRANRKNCV